MITIIILWLILGFLHLITYAGAIAGVNNWKDKIILMILFMVGGPFFSITVILEFIISLILGEGWNDDDDDGPLGGG